MSKLPLGVAKGRCGCLTAAYQLPVHQRGDIFLSLL